MTESIVAFFQSAPPELVTALLASLPVTELRAAIPVALTFFNLNPFVVYVSAVLGNILPIALIYAVIPRLIRHTSQRVPAFDKAMNKWFEKLEKKYGENYSKWGALFLLLFVAIPLPGSGVWTGTVLAILFNVKRELAIPYIVLGVMIAGLLVLGLTQGVFAGLQLL
ncbi:MAG: small multi-drug export protein [Parcubacteria group bacterium]|nr:small multi-drug export protein [Parcubacteria group bacterium]